MDTNGIPPLRKFPSQQRTWFYIVGKSPEGRTVLIGPEATSQAANERGFQAFNGVFEVYELPTRDRSKATSILKAKLLDATGNLSEALKPVKHTIEEGKW